MSGVCEACQVRPATAVVLADSGFVDQDGAVRAELVGLCRVCLDAAGDLIDLVDVAGLVTVEAVTTC